MTRLASTGCVVICTLGGAVKENQSRSLGGGAVHSMSSASKRVMTISSWNLIGGRDSVRPAARLPAFAAAARLRPRRPERTPPPPLLQGLGHEGPGAS